MFVHKMVQAKLLSSTPHITKTSNQHPYSPKQSPMQSSTWMDVFNMISETGSKTHEHQGLCPQKPLKALKKWEVEFHNPIFNFRFKKKKKKKYLLKRDSSVQTNRQTTFYFIIRIRFQYYGLLMEYCISITLVKSKYH